MARATILRGRRVYNNVEVADPCPKTCGRAVDIDAGDVAVEDTVIATVTGVIEGFIGCSVFITAGVYHGTASDEL